MYCDGFLEIKLDYFITYKETLLNYQCCDLEYPTYANTYDGKCRAPCRIVFDICMEDVSFNAYDYFRLSTKYDYCNVIKYQSELLGFGSFKLNVSEDVPISETIKNKRKNLKLSTITDNSFKLKFKSGSFADPDTQYFGLGVDIAHKYRRMRFDPPAKIIEHKARLPFTREWQELHIESEHGKAVLHVRTVCEEGAIGVACNKGICNSTTDSFANGHCTDYGITFCKQGWTGKYCDQPYCSRGCHVIGGVCAEPDFCKCNYGWNKDDCSYCMKDRFCIDSHSRCQTHHSCVCTYPWVGARCQINWFQCLIHNPCENGGRCSITTGLYDKNEPICRCLDGYTGARCETKLPLCASYIPPCYNGGICIDIDENNYKCDCPKGRTGDQCLSSINDCHGQCHNNATCKDGHMNYTCECLDGFDGELCEININECQTSPCINGACVDQVNNYECVCKNGFKGKNCETPCEECKTNVSNMCLSNPCKHGECLDRVDNYECICDIGYTGKDCETDIDYCLSSPCVNGTCQDMISGFVCNCEKGYEGYKCQHEINECNVVKCSNQGVCIDMINGYSCSCLKYYSGVHCEIGPDYCLSSPCINGKCSNSNDTFECSCTTGYSGQTCEVNIDDCVASLCNNNGKCVDGLNNYTCECNHGFHGSKCEYIDSCAQLPCQNSGTCVRLHNNDYHCQCAAGFFGKSCQGVEDSCYRPISFENGTSTTMTKLIPTYACGDHGECISLTNEQFMCQCDNGYKGERCQTNIDDCYNHHCQNQGTCMDSEEGYTCMCPSGYSGKFCQEEEDFCLDKPCKNKGDCISIVNDFICACKEPWKGKTCATSNSSCSDSPCQNEGTCREVGNNFMCMCTSGYSGRTCAQRVTACLDDICKNGGTCLNTAKSYKCSCRPGFTGQHCETNINECSSDPCMNEATCRDDINWYECICKQGYFGQTCQYEYNECLSKPCSDGSTCVDLIGSYHCVCNNGFTGNNCSVATSFQHCNTSDGFYRHNESWPVDCNECKCYDGQIKCTNIWCGPTNCLENNVDDIDCSCHAVDVQCITPPCKQWGECQLKPMQVENGGCSVLTPEDELSYNCAKVELVFDTSNLPKGISVPEVCQSYREVTVLKEYATDSELRINCAHEVVNGSTSILILSVYSATRSAGDIAVDMSKVSTNDASNILLNHIQRCVISTQVIIEKNTSLFYTKDSDNKMTIAIAVLAVIIIIILAAVFGYIGYRRQRQARLNQNQQPVETQRNNLHKTDEKKIDNQKVTANAPFYVSSPSSKLFPTIVEIGHTSSGTSCSPDSVCSKECCCQANLCENCTTYNHNLKLRKPGTSPDKSNYIFI